jgi:hypothetical protein
LMAIFSVDRITIYNWFDAWEAHHFAGLYDRKIYVQVLSVCHLAASTLDGVRMAATILSLLIGPLRRGLDRLVYLCYKTWA